MSIALDALSPKHREWSRLLASLTLDPDRLSRPVDAPPAGDFMICGSPRSGTALLTAMLFQPPNVTTVMEPWDGLRLPPAELFSSLRDELAGTGRLGRGRLDLAALNRDGEVRWCRDGELPHDVHVAEDFRLGVKFPAFWRYLDLLPNTRFLVCLRHPYEVIKSYELTGGRLGEGLDYDVPFNRAMNDHLLAATDDPAVRRVMLYDYIYRSVSVHLDRPNVYPVRYERWFTDPDGQLAEISEFLGVDVTASRVRLRPPMSRGAGDRADLGRIRDHCSIAKTLGYEL
jgi:Sulfotransferase family